MENKYQLDEAIRKIEAYQRNYEAVLMELEDEKKLLRLAENGYEKKMEQLEKEWIHKVKQIQKIKAL